MSYLSDRLKMKSEYEVGDIVEIVNNGTDGGIIHYHGIGTECTIIHKKWYRDSIMGIEGYWSYILENEINKKTQTVVASSFKRARPKIVLDDSLFEVD